MLALLLAVLPVGPPLAVTEHALVTLAQQQGQWTAFRGFMAPGAYLLDPEVKSAATVLETRADPAVARMWWPSRTITSCDGGLAVSTGPFRRGGVGGRFFTVWERQADRSWKWIFDGSIDEATVLPAGEEASAVTATCRPAAPPMPLDTMSEASGASADGSLRWRLVRALDRDRHRLVVDYDRNGHWNTFADVTVSQ